MLRDSSIRHQIPSGDGRIWLGVGSKKFEPLSNGVVETTTAALLKAGIGHASLADH